MSKHNETTLNISAHKASIILGLIGLVCTVISVIWTPVSTDWISVALDELIMIIGSTLIGSCAISLLLEISTLKDENAESVRTGCIKVLDTVYGNDPQYLQNLSPEKNEQVRTQLTTAYINQRSNNHHFADSDIRNSPIQKFNDLISNSLINGITCNRMDRKIQITPVTGRDGVTYRISINEYYNLSLLNDDAILAIRNHRFRFISQRQNDSFRLKSIVVNGTQVSDMDNCVEKISSLNSRNDSAVADRTFNYLVSVKIPVTRINNGELEYRIDYEYENYEMGTYLTSALSYPTKNIHEVYTLVGSEASNFIIHGFSHFPYHSQPGKKIHFRRIHSVALDLTITDDWQLPGSGSSVVVRQRTNSSELLD